MKKSTMMQILLINYGLLLSSTQTLAHPQSGLGQTITIQTRLSSYIGRPTWFLEIRDIDHNQTIPYLFNIDSGSNTWIALTYGSNYLIYASRIQFPSYRSRYNDFKSYRINNFCKLESRGRIIKNESLQIYISGDISPHSTSYQCKVLRFKGSDSTIHF